MTSDGELADDSSFNESPLPFCTTELDDIMDHDDLDALADEEEEALSVHEDMPEDPRRSEEAEVSAAVPSYKEDAELERLLSIRYDRHKPKWWKQRVGRYVTKPQRRTLEAMAAYRLSKPAYGSVLDFATLFGRSPPPGPPPPQVWIELGFGKGDNLLCLAQRHPDVCFVGVEVHPSSAAICLQHMQGAIERKQEWVGYQLYNPCLDPFSNEYQNELSENGAHDTSEWGTTIAPGSAHPLENVRIYGGDGIVLLESGVASDTVDAILITFPDPFPTDPPHRILQVHTVNTLYQRLKKPGGRLYLATDHAGFFAWAVQVVGAWNHLRCGAEGRTETPLLCLYNQLVPLKVERSEWLPVVSRYERKGWDEGRRTLLQCWEVRKNGTDLTTY